MCYCFFTNHGQSPKSDASRSNIKYSYIEAIYAAAGSICHDEIVVLIGVPGPEGKTAFHHIINGEGLFWVNCVGAIAAYNLRRGLIKIYRKRKCYLR